MDNGAGSYRRFLEGDEAGLVEIIRDYKDGLIFYLNSFVGDLHIAEELAEDTFVKLGVRKPKDRGKSSFKTWLYAIGRHVAIDYLRRVRRNTVPLDACSDLPDESSPETAYLQEERKRLLHRAMRRLRPEYRQVLWLMYFEQFSHREIAAVLGKRVHAVETLAYRARRALKTELDKEDFVYEDL